MVLDSSVATLSVTDAAALAAATTNPNNFVVQVDNEEMLVTAVNVAQNTLTVQRGYNNTTAASHFDGGRVVEQPSALVVAAPTLQSAVATTLTVSNAAALGAAPPFVVQVDDEQMLVTAVTGNTLTVQRGYNGTTLALHAPGATVSVVSQLTAAIDSTATISVSNAAALQAAAGGAASFAVQVDNEQMLVTGVDAVHNTVTVQRGYAGTTVSSHNISAPVALEPALIVVDSPVLLDQTLAADSTLTVSNADADALAAGNALPFVIGIDAEQMLVTAISGPSSLGTILTVMRGYNATSPAAHRAGASIAAGLGLDASSGTIAVSNAAELQAAAGQPANFVVQIDSEQILVTAVDDADNLLTVLRGYHSTPASHAAGAAISVVGAAEYTQPLGALHRRAGHVGGGRQRRRFAGGGRRRGRHRHAADLRQFRHRGR